MIVLLPPLIVLTLGYLTRRVILSLLGGIISAALIAQNFSPVQTGLLVAHYLWHNLEFSLFFTSIWDCWNSLICLFLLMLGTLVTLIRHAGGAFAYGKFVHKFLKDSRSAETSSLALSSCLFVDDYFSSLTVGSVMSPITDTYKIPRPKLAFLVDAMAAPLAILCPFSSWVAAIVGFLRDNGVSSIPAPSTHILASPFTSYLEILPYIFYSFTAMLGTFFIVRFSISFGLMRVFEKRAKENNDLAIFQKKERLDVAEKNLQSASMIDFIIPILSLLFSVLSGLLFSGNFYLFGGNRAFLEAMQNSSAAIALFTGGLFSLSFTTLFFLFRKKVSLTELPLIYKEGILEILPAVVVLLLAWTMGDILRYDLKTGQYLAEIMLGSMPAFLLPFMFFIAATLIAFSIGSSWGTAAILFPIAIPMVSALSQTALPIDPETLPIIWPTLGAVLSGCVAGDHISPISDTTVMSSTSTGSMHVDHVNTQMTYALPYIFSTAIAYLICSFLLPMGKFIAITSSMGASLLLLVLILLIQQKREASV